MKNYRKFFFYYSIILLFSTLTAQGTEFIEKNEFYDQALGGECLIKNSIIRVDGETSMKIFEIEVPVDGDYYLSAWMMNTSFIEKSNGLKFYVDDEKNPAGKVKPNKESWQSVKLLETNETKSKKMRLTSGKHTITFCSIIPEIPPVEFIRISRNESDTNISGDNWTNYFETAKRNIFEPVGDSLGNGVFFKTEDDPRYLYENEHNTYFTYTYFAYLYLSVGSIELETRKVNPYGSDPVMYLFKSQDPNTYSWYDDNSGSGYQSLIIAQISSAGTYCVMVRSSGSNQSQTSDLYLNNSLYASNIVISGASISCNQTLTQQLNYFTSYPTGDPMLWLQRNDNKVHGFNDDYSGSGDFVWQQNARVKYTLTSGQSITKCFLTSSSTYYPTGYCDLYVGCKNLPDATRNTWYNFKADDAIMSGNYVPYPYNCYSWSGGITSYSEIPYNPGSNFYVENDILASFDNFYSNNPLRYYDAADWNYTRLGATESNSLIDLWQSTYDHHIAHAAINGNWQNNPDNRPANDHMHTDMIGKVNGAIWKDSFIQDMFLTVAI